MHIEGDEINVSDFILELPKKIPEASSISFFEAHDIEPENFIEV